MKGKVKFSLTILLLVSFVQTKAQSFDKLINENKVDTFAFYKTPNSVMIFLFWTKQNKCYLSKEVYKQKTKVIETISMDTFCPLTFYLQHDTEIDNSTIKPFTYLKNTLSAKQDTLTLNIAHKPQYEWTIYQGQGFKTTSLNAFNLWEGSIKNETNIYFAYNNSQPIATFFKKTEELLHQIGWTK